MAAGWDGASTHCQELEYCCQLAQHTYAQYKLFEATGDISPATQPARESTRKLSGRDELHIIGLVLAHPTVYLYEVCQQVEDAFGKSVSPTTVCHYILA